MKRITSFLLAIVLFAGLVLTGAPVVYAASEMTVSDALVEVLKKEEGFSAKPYWDYGQYTVGYGTRCPDDMLEEYQENGISEADAEVLLRNYLAGTENVINKKFIDKYGLTLTQSQFDALVTFTYNLGSSWIYDTTGNFHNAIKNGVTGSELIRVFSLWCNAGGSILPGLVRRRLCEANMYLNGVYSVKQPSNYGYVYYNANGGSVSYRIQGYDANEGVAPAYKPTYSGHEFLGWYTAKTGGEKVSVLNMSLSGKTLYARWNSTEEEETETIPAEGVAVLVTGTNVNLRKGPGTNYTIVGTADKGDELVITETASGSGYEWGNAGDKWIALKYTNYDEAVKEQEKVPEETTEPTETTEPETTEPETTEPETTEPETTEPETTVPETTVPETTAPETTVPETTEPETTAPETTAPETTAPETTAPETTEPETTVPETTKPADTTVTGTVKANGGLAVRKGPGTGYARVKYLANGSKVTITEQKKVGSMTWGKISSGWISMSYVVLDSAEKVPETTVPEATVPETTKPAGTTVTGTVKANGGLAVRKGPGTNYGRIKYIANGTKVTVTEQKKVGSTTWGKISSGWISMKYVVLDKAGSTPETTAPEATKPETTVPETTVPEATVPETTVPEVTVPETNAPQETKITGKIKATGGLAVRKGPGTSYAVKKYLKNGSQITITEVQEVKGTKWGNVGDGWISMDYVILDGQTSTNTSVTKTVTADCLRVRQTASTSAKIVGYYYEGARVTILETANVGGTTWGRTSKGWISMAYVK